MAKFFGRIVVAVVKNDYFCNVIAGYGYGV